MNLVIQNILVIIVCFVAIRFLVKKFFWKPKKATTAGKKLPGSCGSGDCGCH